MKHSIQAENNIQAANRQTPLTFKESFSNSVL